MNKSDLISAMAAEAQMSKADAKKAWFRTVPNEKGEQKQFDSHEIQRSESRL